MGHVTFCAFLYCPPSPRSRSPASDAAGGSGSRSSPAVDRRGKRGENVKGDFEQDGSDPPSNKDRSDVANQWKVGGHHTETGQLRTHLHQPQHFLKVLYIVFLVHPQPPGSLNTSTYQRGWLE